LKVTSFSGLFFPDFFCGLLFYGTFVVSTYCKPQFGRVFVKISHFGLVFWICLPAFVFNFPAAFVNFS